MHHIIMYHSGAVAVKNSPNITRRGVYINVLRTIVANNRERVVGSLKEGEGVAALIVFVHLGRILVTIIHANQLTHAVIGVRCSYIPLPDAGIV